MQRRLQILHLRGLIGYLHGDRRLPSFYAWVSLFTSAMLLVVVASDLLELYVGWEVMGICSYLLIGHDRRLREAPRAAVKAFLVTRVGDGVAWIYGLRNCGYAEMIEIEGINGSGRIIALGLQRMPGVQDASAFEMSFPSPSRFAMSWVEGATSVLVTGHGMIPCRSESIKP